MTSNYVPWRQSIIAWICDADSRTREHGIRTAGITVRDAERYRAELDDQAEGILLAELHAIKVAQERADTAASQVRTSWNVWDIL